MSPNLPASRGAGRLEASPAEPRRHLDVAVDRRLDRAPRGLPAVADLGAHELARILGMQVQRGSVRDVQDHDIVAGAGGDAHGIAGSAPGAHAHRRFHCALHFGDRSGRAAPAGQAFELQADREPGR